MATRKHGKRQQQGPFDNSSNTSNQSRIIPPRPGSLSVLSRLGLPTAATTSQNGLAISGSAATTASTGTDKDGDLVMGSTSTSSTSRRL